MSRFIVVVETHIFGSEDYPLDRMSHTKRIYFVGRGVEDLTAHHGPSIPNSDHPADIGAHKLVSVWDPLDSD